MRAAVLVILVLLLALGDASAQDRYADIEAQQQRLDRLGNAILASQGRLLQTPTMTSAQERGYDLLNSAHNGLTQVDRELSALYKLMSMQQLVSGDKQVRMARKIVDSQRAYTLKSAASQTDYVEKLTQKAGDSETSRLLFESRDALKATSELLQNL